MTEESTDTAIRPIEGSCDQATSRAVKQAMDRQSDRVTERSSDRPIERLKTERHRMNEESTGRAIRAIEGSKNQSSN